MTFSIQFHVPSLAQYNALVAIFSDRTISALGRILERYNRRVELAALLMEHGAPAQVTESERYANKLSLALGGLGYLRENDMGSDLQALVEHALSLPLDPEDRGRLDRALLADGFVIENTTLVEAGKAEREARDGLAVLIDRHPEFDRGTLTHHLHECESLYAGGHWGAAIGQARSLCELLLADIARNVATARNETQSLSKPVHVRDYLESVSFLDKTERRKLIDGVYGYLSDEGAHPGISDQTSARVSRLIILGIAFYLIEKYESWLLSKS